jgi:murein DD-endopeptidase MepM/ murein hydrolase activator NlpD
MAKNILKNILVKIKPYSILIISDNPALSTKTRSISLKKIAFFTFVYTLFVAFLVSLVFVFSPVRNFIVTKSSALTAEEKIMLEELSQKLISLNGEVENLRETNQRLNKAIKLNNSPEAKKPNVIKPAPKKAAPAVKSQAAPPAADNVYLVIRKLMEDYGLAFWEDGLFTKPVTGFISKEYNVSKGHLGIDFAVKTGTPVFAAGNGYVVFADYTTNEGYMIIIAHSNNYITVYKHCSSLLKKTRDVVEQGELIALSGNTGLLTTGPHLHFEIWKNGQAINPKSLLVN